MTLFFLSRLWPGLAVWIALFISDYTLTLICARLYRAVGNRVGLAGSYEITPYFQRDIDSLRIVSPRFLIVLLLNVLALALVWRMAPQSLALYPFVLGALIGTELAIHQRHLRNLATFRALARKTVQGRIAYTRRFLLAQSARELTAFAGMFLVLFLFTQSRFVLGGAAGCFVVAVKHWRLARGVRPAPESNPASSQLSNRE